MGFANETLQPVRGQRVGDGAMNPDKKGEEVTDKIVRLSEELMNTPQPFRGGILMTRPRPGSIEQEGEARESGNQGHPLEIWGAGYSGRKLKKHALSPVR